MEHSNLLIVFVKNPNLGKVKTRLATSIGDAAALEVYLHLLNITERTLTTLFDCDVHVYYSSETNTPHWPAFPSYVQQGKDLGERMRNAFQHGFDQGYERIIGIGSDLPDLNTQIIYDGFHQLSVNETVFGPSEDGGYYLLGMSFMIPAIFEHKPWSTDQLMKETLKELVSMGMLIAILEELNDIDTLEDLRSSSIAPAFHFLWTSNRL